MRGQHGYGHRRQSSSSSSSSLDCHFISIQMYSNKSVSLVQVSAKEKKKAVHESGDLAVCLCVSPEGLTLYHFLGLAEINILPVLTPRLVFLDVHDTDKRHGSSSEEEDGEEHNDDSGGANELTLLYGLQAQMKAQSIRDRTAQP